jgi:uncharacterized protein
MEKASTRFPGQALLFIFFALAVFKGLGQEPNPKFKVIAFYTAKEDLAHISFVHEANRWFPEIAAKYHFEYDSTNNWNNLNPEFLSQYQIVVFLDTRPEEKGQRDAFKDYMDHGGGWIGFHFAGFALDSSAVPQNWDWYHNQFLGSGQYVSNTWRPVAAILKVEDSVHPATRGLPGKFRSAPNEWYRWQNNLTQNPDIDILLSIDPSSYPLGTGPKPNEIWRSGYYPVVWTNKHYKMMYVNMGHNDMDYEHQYDFTNKTLSSSFSSVPENTLIINAILWMGSSKK